MEFPLVTVASFRAYLLVVRRFTISIVTYSLCFVSLTTVSCILIAVCTVLGLEEGKECIIVGTLYKHMKLKPSVLDEYSKEVQNVDDTTC